MILGGPPGDSRARALQIFYFLAVFFEMSPSASAVSSRADIGPYTGEGKRQYAKDLEDPSLRTLDPLHQHQSSRGLVSVGFH